MITYSPPGAPFTSNLIPYGKADLLIGVDVLEAARALDPSTNQRVGSRHHTAVVVNTHKTPTILTLLGKDDFEVAQLEQLLSEHTRAEAYFSADLSKFSEYFFGTQLYANIMMLGVAFQRGLLPLRLASIEWALHSGLGPAAAENRKAFNLGRYIAHDVATVRQAAGFYREPTTYEEVLADKAGLLSCSRRRGPELARSYRQLVQQAARQLPEEEVLRGDFARRVYDLIQYEDIDYARRYVEMVLDVAAADRADFGFAATRAIIWNLHKVMAIKDEVYVAHLLTSEEKRRRDRARYQVDPVRGDRLEYRHLNRPQLTLLGRDLAWNLKTRDWMLNLVKRMRWLRRLLPDWHRPEREFRDWYCGLAAQFPEMAGEPDTYQSFVRILTLPESVTGYREIRYPKMAAARQQAALWLKELREASGAPAQPLETPAR
jgi:indolepyruvate ferredoxin oxidoreductase